MTDRLIVPFKTEREVMVVVALCFSECDELDTPSEHLRPKNPAPTSNE